MAQYARPDADLTATNIGGGTFDSINEASPSDVDFLYGIKNTAVTYICSLTDPVAPAVDSGHTIRYRIAKLNDTTVDTGGAAVYCTVSLLQGVSTVLASDAQQTALGWTTREWVLPEAVVANITDYSDLRLRFVSPASGGNATTRRGIGISWAELEVPDAQEISETSLSYTQSISGSASLNAQNQSTSSRTHSLTGDSQANLQSSTLEGLTRELTASSTQVAQAPLTLTRSASLSTEAEKTLSSAAEVALSKGLTAQSEASASEGNTLEHFVQVSISEEVIPASQTIEELVNLNTLSAASAAGQAAVQDSLGLAKASNLQTNALAYLQESLPLQRNQAISAEYESGIDETVQLNRQENLSPADQLNSQADLSLPATRNLSPTTSQSVFAGQTLSKTLDSSAESALTFSESLSFEKTEGLATLEEIGQYEETIVLSRSCSSQATSQLRTSDTIIELNYIYELDADPGSNIVDESITIGISLNASPDYIFTASEDIALELNLSTVYSSELSAQELTTLDIQYTTNYSLPDDIEYTANLGAQFGLTVWATGGSYTVESDTLYFDLEIYRSIQATLDANCSVSTQLKVATTTPQELSINRALNHSLDINQTVPYGVEL